MNQQDNKIHFRKTLYFKMSLLILFLGVVFFGALLSVYVIHLNKHQKNKR